MCGICGFIDFNKSIASEVIDKMVATLNHRGPDDEGSEIHEIENAFVALGHARLSIIDLSMAGHQPMNYKHLSIVFNGEIYNYKELKEQLLNLGHNFISESDTEVILHSYDEWGTDAVKKFIGMFSFAIFDKIKSEIKFFRDRAGIKPFYYYYHNGLFLFASELKAFHQHPRFEKELDLEALSLYFHYNCVPSPYCIFKYAYKLDPGNFLSFNIKTRIVKIEKYWDVSEFYLKPYSDITYVEAKKEVERLLKSSCEYRMLADVPVGIFLSGGYDSASVVAMLQKDRTERLKTFTIGFEEGMDEAPAAKEIARHFGTDHTEYYCTSETSKSIIPELAYYFDEPFADSSAIPTTLVSKLARQDVTVALSGDGGDELFAGYRNYRIFLKYLKMMDVIPPFASEIVKMWVKLFSRLLPDDMENVLHKMQSMAKIIKLPKNEQAARLYQLMWSMPDSYSQKLIKKSFNGYQTNFNNEFKGFRDRISIALAIDYSMYLPNDILTKVDRASMSVSLEAREPLLDHRLVEFLAVLPFEYKDNGKTKKLILKDVLFQYIPAKLMNRPKSGFSLPIDTWLLSDLGFMLKEYLSEPQLRLSGVLNVPFCLDLVQRYKENRLHYKTMIWKLLQFQMWYLRWMN